MLVVFSVFLESGLKGISERPTIFANGEKLWCVDDKTQELFESAVEAALGGKTKS